MERKRWFSIFAAAIVVVLTTIILACSVAKFHHHDCDGSICHTFHSAIPHHHDHHHNHQSGHHHDHCQSPAGDLPNCPMQIAFGAQLAQPEERQSLTDLFRQLCQPLFLHSFAAPLTSERVFAVALPRWLRSSFSRSGLAIPSSYQPALLLRGPPRS